MSEHYVSVDGEGHLRRTVWDFHMEANRPETDAETIARVRREAEEDARAKARLASPAGQVDERRRKALRVLAMPIVANGRVLEPEITLDALNVHLADAFLLPADEAEEKLAEARKPAKDARAEVRAAKAALPLTATSGLAPAATLEAIRQARLAHEEAAAHVADLEARAALLESSIDPQLAIRARGLRDSADRAIEERRLGTLRVPLPGSDYVWTDEDACLLCHLVHVDADAPSDVYTAKYGIGLPSGSPVPTWHGLHALAGLPTAGRQFVDDAGPSAPSPGTWLCQDAGFQKRLAHALRAGLGARFGLDAQKGRALRQQANASQYGGARLARLGVDA